MTRGIAVAIDGPAGAGKSTVSKLLAQRAGLQLLDTGAMYRAFTWAWLSDMRANSATRPIDSARNHEIEVVYRDGRTVVQCDGVDISLEIRQPEVTARVSEVAAVPAVREMAVAMQRQLVETNVESGIGVVLEGRDIGTTVLPDATIKFFLNADSRERALRRALENGANADLVHAEIEERDRADSEREVSPLRAASDAIHIDATHLTPEQVVDVMMDAINANSI